MLPWGGLWEGLLDRGEHRPEGGRRRGVQLLWWVLVWLLQRFDVESLGGEPGESRKASNARVRPQGSKGLQLGMGLAAVVGAAH